MTDAELRARNWCGAACTAAQIAATGAGMLPWWALPFTLALTVAVSLPTGPVDQTRARLTRIAGVAAVAAFTTIIAMRSINQGQEGLVDPTATLRSLTEALVVLSLIMAPNARTPRDHRVWLTVTLGVLVAAAAGGRSVGTGVLTGAAWVVVLIATNRVQVTDAYANGAVAGAVVGMPAKERVSLLGRADTVVPIAATLAFGAIVFAVVPDGLGGTDLARRIARSVQHANFVLADRDEVGVDTHGFGDLSLLVRGELPDTPIITVPESSPSLWRATFYRIYTGIAWTNNAGIASDTAGPSATIQPLADDLPSAEGLTRTDQVQVEATANADLIWAPGVVTHLQAPETQLRRVLRGGENIRVVGDPGQPLTTYIVKSVVAPTSVAVLENAAGEDPANPLWTQLPSEVPAEVPSLARQITAGAANRYQMVQAIEAYLHQHETYSLAAPVPPRGRDAVDDFLFHTHVGFCELFASAEAVLLRSVGVPARVVSGLAYGTPQGSRRLYSAQNAHAWVEVYYPGVGWSPTDPTAGVALADGSKQGPLSRAFNAIAGAVPGGRMVVAVMGALMFVLMGSAIRRAVLGRGYAFSRRRRRGAGKPPGPVLAAFLRMIEGRDGPPPRAPAETPRQYLARVAGQTSGVHSAVLALEQELYGEGPPTDAEVQAAIETFQSLATPATK